MVENAGRSHFSFEWTLSTQRPPPTATLLTEISSEVPDEGSSQPPEISETT